MPLESRTYTILKPKYQSNYKWKNYVERIMATVYFFLPSLFVSAVG